MPKPKPLHPDLAVTNPAALISTMLRTEPFQPFNVVTTSGKRFLVDHPDFIVPTPDFVIWMDRERRNVTLIMASHIEHAEYPALVPPPPKPRKEDR